MDRREFMRQLELLLSDISEEERREALEYYESYFDEAEEEEASVIQKLGSPGKVAASIKADLRENDETSDACVDAAYQPQRKGGRGKMTLVFILLILCSPFLIGAAGGLLGVLITILLIPFLIVLGVIGAVILGVVLVSAGIGLCFSFTAGGIFTIGIGLIFTALGLVGIVFLVWLIRNPLPKFLRWFTDGCHKLLRRERKDGRMI